MWWETLPSMAVVCFALSAPSIFNYVTNYITIGTPFYRKVYTYIEAHGYLRDQRLNNNADPYVQKGLDSLDSCPVEVKEEVIEEIPKDICEELMRAHGLLPEKK